MSNKFNWLMFKVFDVIWKNGLFYPIEGNKNFFFPTAICFHCLEIFIWKSHTPWVFWQIVLAELIIDLEEPIKRNSQRKVAFSIVGQESHESNLWSLVLGGNTIRSKKYISNPVSPLLQPIPLAFCDLQPEEFW